MSYGEFLGVVGSFSELWGYGGDMVGILWGYCGDVVPVKHQKNTMSLYVKYENTYVSI